LNVIQVVLAAGKLANGIDYISQACKDNGQQYHLKDLCRRHVELPTDVGEKDTLGTAAFAIADVVSATDDVIASAGAMREPTVVCALESVKITNIEKIITRIKRGVNTYDQKRTIEYAILWSMTI